LEARCNNRSPSSFLQNIAKREQLLSQVYPMGMLGMPHQTIVDFSEAGIFLKTWIVDMASASLARI
jgi:hypothetical protein